ncbi:hypothetical protein SDC9_104864 [bioreactor metagenome]|uniref:Uncharacterized protein n=1 Tax=bioreactor metagenome TaxID=1076179 RepID=A0A645AXR2_9ZZZZ
MLAKLRTALAHAHGAEGAVPGVGVGAKNHFPTAGQLLPGVGVNDALVGGDVDAAVFLRGRKAEGVVVPVDGAAHGAQAVVAVGQGVGQGEFPHPGGPGLLENAHVGDVVGNHRVKAEPQLVFVAGSVVALQDGPGQSAPAPFLRGDGRGFAGNAFGQKYAGGVQRNHEKSLPDPPFLQRAFLNLCFNVAQNSSYEKLKMAEERICPAFSSK